ncbi:MAG: hypothetical protein KGL39_09625 [Patescibacteria group bacterium]|nr:hypothetical protein [Patescibacteria group bacterium]
MKLEFDSPLDYTTGAAIDPTTLASLAYTVFIDTVNPPVKSYPVASSAVANATTNANGTKHITVDCVAGDATGFTPIPGTKYFCAVQDSVSEGGTPVLSAESPVIEYTYDLTPTAPANFGVGS